MEIWKDVLGFEGKYQVSNLGMVRRVQGKGRKQTSLMKQQKKKWWLFTSSFVQRWKA